MNVEWLPEAARSLSSQIEWIARDDPMAAVVVGDALDAAVARLGDYPAMGRPARVHDTRELVVTGTPYLVIYRLEAVAVVVLRVLHGAQGWPPM